MCLQAYEVALRFLKVISLASNIDTFVPTPHPQLYQLVIPGKPGYFSQTG